MSDPKIKAALAIASAAETISPKPETPSRLAERKRSDAGTIVPWAAEFEDGVHRCMQERRCAMCGHQLGRNVAWIVTLIEAVTHKSFALPMHYECAAFRCAEIPLEEVIAVYVTRNARVVRASAARRISRSYVDLGPAERVELYKDGKRLPAEEALELVQGLKAEGGS